METDRISVNNSLICIGLLCNKVEPTYIAESNISFKSDSYFVTSLVVSCILC